MKDILEEILAYKRKEVEREKAELPPEQLFALVEGRWRNAHDGTARHGKVPAYMTDARKHRSMRESLAASRSGIIAEFKRKSPSKGWIKEEGRADVIPAAYAAAGAAAGASERAQINYPLFNYILFHSLTASIDLIAS